MALGPPEASRRALVTSAAAVAGTGVALMAAPAYAGGNKKPHQVQGPEAAQGPREAPGLPLQLRHHAGAGDPGPRGRWCPRLVGAAAHPGRHPGRLRRPAAVLVAHAQPVPAGHVGPGQDGHDARLRRVPGLPAVRADAPHLLQPSGPRADDGVLGEPPQHPAERRAVVPLPPFVRRDVARRRRSAGTRTSCSPPSPTRRCSSTSTTPTPPPRTRTRTSAASCSSCTPSASATTARTTSRTPPASSPAGGSTPSRATRPRPGSRRTSRATTPWARSRSWTSPTRTAHPTAATSPAATSPTSPTTR